jgi:uncharacterized protein (TIGR04141 family)
MIDVVKREHGAKAAREFASALKDRWTFEFQIADFSRRDGTHNIPFFSKLTLREEARNIESMDFDIRLAFITLQRIEASSSQ